MSELSAVGALPPHEVLLWLAGRIDDDMLAWGRELVAVGEDDQAIELITATLIADRVQLPVMLRDWVVERSAALKLEPDADQELPPAGDHAPVHTFVADLAGKSEAAAARSERLHTALAGVGERHLRDGNWWLAWRLTPAGAAPGPLPHPVILVELAADSATSAEVVAYQMADAVQRGGLTASVEVFVAGAALPEYHRSALRIARGQEPAAPAHAAEPAEPVEPVEPLAAPVATPVQVTVPAETAPAHALAEPLAEPAAEPVELLGSVEPVDVRHTEAAGTAAATDSWSDEWVTGEWSESPDSPQLAALSETERVLLAQLQEELTAREAQGRSKRGNGSSAPKRPDVAEPPGLTG